MVSKNNKQVLLEKSANKVYRYAVKRLSVGVASVAVAAGLLFSTQATVAQAAVEDNATDTAEVVGPSAEKEPPVSETESVENTEEAAAPSVTEPSVETETVEEAPAVSEESSETVESNTTEAVEDKEATKESVSNDSNSTNEASVENDSSEESLANEEHATADSSSEDKTSALESESSATITKAYALSAPASPTPALESESLATGNVSLGAKSLETADEGTKHEYNTQNIVLTFDDILDPEKNTAKTLDYKLTYYNAAIPRSVMKVRIVLDDEIANQVDTIIINKNGNTSSPQTFSRVSDNEGQLTNIWELPIRQTHDGAQGVKEMSGTITFKQAVKDVFKLEQENTPIYGYRAFVFDPNQKKIVEDANQTGVFVVNRDQKVAEPTTDTQYQKLYRNSASQIIFNPSIGTHGGFIIDHMMNKATGVPMTSLMNKSKFNIKIDPRLVQYIDHAELHFLPYRFVGGVNYEYLPENYRTAIEFNDQGLAGYQGTGRFADEILNINGAQNPSIIRAVLPLNQDVSNLIGKNEEGNLAFKVNDGQLLLPITTYFSTSDGGLIPGTDAYGALLAFTVEDIAPGVTEDKDTYEPSVTPVEKDYGTPTTEEDVTGAVTVPNYPATDENGNPVEQPTVTVDDPTTLPDGNTPGDYTIPVTVTYPDGSTDTTTVTVTVKEAGSEYVKDPYVDGEEIVDKDITPKDEEAASRNENGIYFEDPFVNGKQVEATKVDSNNNNNATDTSTTEEDTKELSDSDNSDKSLPQTGAAIGTGIAGLSTLLAGLGINLRKRKK
ncbi:MAG: Rib/alpha-like domain-containing protein [Aerococcus suis]|nr:Rib/alpha-like domain-containing protein [Aerococcus suis]